MKFSELMRRKHPLAALILVSAIWLLGSSPAWATFKTVLQGQNAGNTNWVNGPLTGWKELDIIPMRTLSTGGPPPHQGITPRLYPSQSSGTARGIPDPTRFLNFAHVLLTAPPTL